MQAPFSAFSHLHGTAGPGGAPRSLRCFSFPLLSGCVAWPAGISVQAKKEGGQERKWGTGVEKDGTGLGWIAGEEAEEGIRDKKRAAKETQGGPHERYEGDMILLISLH